MKYGVIILWFVLLVYSPLFAAPAKIKSTLANQKPVYRKIVPHPYMIFARSQSPVSICIISPDLRSLNEMTQNAGRALPNPCNPIWPYSVALSAGANIDAGKWGGSHNYMGENNQSLSVNDAYINLLATANHWVSAFGSVSFSNPTIHENNGYPSSSGRFGAAEYSAAYANNIKGGNRSLLQLEQAYATLGDFHATPLFLQLGKQYQDFSRYQIHPITRRLTQVMSETLAVSGKVGLIANGFHGSLYALRNEIGRENHPSNKSNYGAALGFDQPECNGFRWNIGVGYLYNLMGVNDIAYNVINFSKSNAYHRRVGGTAVYADLYDGPFTVHGRYTTAIQRFSAFDLPKHGVADLTQFNIRGTLRENDAHGAKPWAAGIDAGYQFNTLLCRDQNIYVGYEMSRESSGLNMPRSRWLAGYNIDVWKTTNVGIEWDKDHAYNVTNGGAGGTSDLVTLRAAIKVN